VKFIALLITLAAFTATAETIKVPVGQQTSGSEITRPARGMKKQQVFEAFGEPNSQTAPKGTPPISNWKYDGFTVYFEYDHVIHTVLTHQRQDGAAPKQQ
jgi:hypothetical protein